MDTKTCTRCQEDLPATSFGQKTSTQLQSACKSCQRSISAEWYVNNKQRQIDNARRNNVAFHDTIQRWKKTLTCSKCPESFERCLDFHHLDGSNKEEAIAQMLYSSSWTRIVKELNKCIVLCSNCHRKVHANALDVSDISVINITIEQLRSYATPPLRD